MARSIVVTADWDSEACKASIVFASGHQLAGRVMSPQPHNGGQADRPSRRRAVNNLSLRHAWS